MIRRKRWAECRDLNEPIHEVVDFHGRPCDRLYYLIELTETRHMARIFRDVPTGEWFVERLWD